MFFNLSDYLWFLDSVRVIVCKSHQNFYTQAMLKDHLLRTHCLHKISRDRIIAYLSLRLLALTLSEMIHFVNEVTQISALSTYQEYICHVNECEYRSICAVTMRQHYNQKHQIYQSKHEKISWHCVILQTLFVQSKLRRYFAVVSSDQWVNEKQNFQQYIFSRSDHIERFRLCLSQLSSIDARISSVSVSVEQNSDSRESLINEYSIAQNSYEKNFRTLNVLAHVFEITLWLKRSTFTYISWMSKWNN